MPPAVPDAPDLSGLIELSRDPNLDLKPVVLRVQTDLFLAAPIRDRAALEAFGSLAAGLIPTVDEDTALIVARKLCPCPDTPLSVLVRLAERGGAIGDVVIASAVNLSEPVIEAARRAGVDVRAAVGERTGDEAAPAAGLSDTVSSARRDADLAVILLARSDLGPADLAPLWLHAEPHQRNAIRQAVEASAALRPCPPAPRGLAATLIECSTRRDVGNFVAALSAGLGLPKDFLGAATDASLRYDLLALALRAADLRQADAIYIFLTLNETVARSVQRVFQLADLYRATSRAAARDLLSAILDVTLPERSGMSEHQSYLGADAAKPRYAASTERALSRAVAPQRIQRTV